MAETAICSSAAAAVGVVRKQISTLVLNPLRLAISSSVQ